MVILMPKFKTYPIESITPVEALAKQHLLVDKMTHHFYGSELLNRGDLGVAPRINQPRYTQKVETTIADYFNVEAAMLVRGAGTAAIRSALHAYLSTGDTLLVHDAPIYPTTKTSIEMLGLKTKAIDYNKLDQIKLPSQPNAILIQYTRQKPADSYNMAHVIKFFRKYYGSVPIITDDNYAVMKVHRIGVELGADLSCFSCFKLLGPEGIGCLVGKQSPIKKIRSENYSGGSQVQGHEALDVLQGLVYAPVALATQALVIDELVVRLNNHEISEIQEAYIANAQSKVLLVEFKKPIAQAVLGQIDMLGGAPNPVGAESKYEMIPMFYRVSGTFKTYDPNLLNTTIRINPYRSGANTIISILKKAITEVVS